MEDPTPENLIHFYDELTEAQAVLPTKEYQAYLTKWGVSESMAAVISFVPNDGCTTSASGCNHYSVISLHTVQLQTTDRLQQWLSTGVAYTNFHVHWDAEFIWSELQGGQSLLYFSAAPGEQDI
nr:unnamed protein product [Spirometra erinaceieuropaei]